MGAKRIGSGLKKPSWPGGMPSGKPIPKCKALPPEVIQEIEKALGQAEIHPRLAGEAKELSETELVEILQELITTSEEISWASLESREPMLAPYFKTYEQRVQVAESVGRELQRRGGSALLRKVHIEKLGSNTALGNWWSGLL